MSGVYVVSFMELQWNEYSNWAFTGFKAAKEKALQLSEEILLRKPNIVMDRDPKQTSHNDPRWFFLDEDDIFLMISFLKIQENSSNISSIKDNNYDTLDLFPPQTFRKFDKDFFSDLLPPIDVLKSKPVSDLHTRKYPHQFDSAFLAPRVEDTIRNMGEDIPAGFSISNKPLTNLHMIKYPYQFKSAVSELTETQKWALITARVNKLSDYEIDMPGFGLMYKHNALAALKSKNEFGKIIVEVECEVLDVLRAHRAAEMDKDNS